jgi:outer membrane protein assembly factor BamB
MKVNSPRLFVAASLLLFTSACSMVENIFTEEVYEAPPSELTEFALAFEPRVIWDRDGGDGTGETGNALRLWHQDGVIVSVDYEGEVLALQAETGQQLWEQDLDTPIITGAGGGMDMVLVGTQQGEVVALSLTEGQEKWRATLTSEVLARPIADDNVVVVRTADGRLTGLNAETGDRLWSYQRNVPLLSLRGASAPQIADGKALVGYDNGKLVALSLSDGKVTWEKNIAVPRGRTELDRLVDIDADPVVKDGTVYVVTYQGSAAGVDLTSGEVMWRRDMSSQLGLDVVPYDAVYITDEDGFIWAVQDGTGDALWRQTRLIRRLVTAPTVVGDYIVMGDLEGYLHFLSQDDGRFVSRIQLGKSAINSQPVVVGNTVYVNDVEGRISAIQVPSL